MLVDTHAHLQWKNFDKDLDLVIGRAKNAKVNHIINIGYNLVGSKESVELTEKYSGLYATVGIHPHNANQLNENVLNELRKLSEHPKVLAIGEIGLDYYRNLAPREVQIEAFEAQLVLAEELGLPVVVHDRNAHADTLKVLSKFKGRIRAVMHCFSGSKEMADQCVKSGYYISFAGPVTFPNARKLQEVAKEIYLNRILLETDSPWLAPQEKRGKRNEPAFLVYIAEKIAELRSTPLGELAEITTNNAKKIFQFS